MRVTRPNGRLDGKDFAQFHAHYEPFTKCGSVFHACVRCEVKLAFYKVVQSQRREIGMRK